MSEQSPITGRCREMERVGGRGSWRRGIERRVRQLDLFSPGFCLCGSVELFLLWKNFLSFCRSPPPPPFPSDSVFLFLGLILCSVYHFVCPLSLFSFKLFHLSFYNTLSLSPLFFRWPPLSVFHLPSSSAYILPGCISSRHASLKRYWNRARDILNRFQMHRCGESFDISLLASKGTSVLCEQYWFTCCSSWLSWRVVLAF